MPRKRHTAEQVLGELRDTDVLLAPGESTAEVTRKLEVSKQNLHRWRNQFGGMKAEERPPPTARSAGSPAECSTGPQSGSAPLAVPSLLHRFEPAEQAQSR